MNKYLKFLEDNNQEVAYLETLLKLVAEGKIEEAKMLAMKIRALRDLKFSLRKVEINGSDN